MKFNVVIRGISPLLMHRFSPDMLTDVKQRSGDKKLTEEQMRKQAEVFAYKEKGKLVQPSIHLEGAMIKAASEIKLSGSGKKTYKETMKSSCFVFPEYIPHKNQDWTVDARAVVMPATKGRRMCYRPRLDKWELEFEMLVSDNRADPDALKEILSIAGLRQGIGSYRPRFGRFEVVSFTETKE